MTRNIREQLLQVAGEADIRVYEVEESRREQLLDDVFRKYNQGHNYAWALWDSPYFAKNVSRERGDAWEWCGDFVGNQDVVLFFNSLDEEAVFAIPSGGALVQILGEMYWSEFYLTDTATDYLLCFNHHDFLIACGRAREWLEHYQPPS